MDDRRVKNNGKLMTKLLLAFIVEDLLKSNILRPVCDDFFIPITEIRISKFLLLYLMPPLNLRGQANTLYYQTFRISWCGHFVSTFDITSLVLELVLAHC